MKTIHIFALIIFISCSEDSPTIPNESENRNDDTNKDWLIPKNQVYDGGPGKDGIPAISEPELIAADEATWLSGNDLVLGIADGDDIRAYPHQILDWHEIINDQTNNHSLAVIYCPLTGTGIGWNRIMDSIETTFGVSGLLYNSNIIPYDRKTDSYWSQLINGAVNGPLTGKQAETINLIETSWETWKTSYPSTKVVSRNTGYSRSYGNYPYGNYKDDELLLFPVSNTDDRLNRKERVLAIFIQEAVKAYTFEKLTAHENLIIDSFQGQDVVVTGSEEANLIVAFQNKLNDGSTPEFDVVHNNLPGILRDNQGNVWDISGRAISGPRTGEQLQSVTQIMGYWFAFVAFYPEIELFDK
ncbi:MAG: DUF3179 domain-containing protein [Bacteroidetes bacterium]|jgi:hypothetical protein|nr:DUF3179 domain-containing protein [Bacteroidota bacterium]